MTPTEWLSSNDPEEMLYALRKLEWRPLSCTLRLLACSWVRRHHWDRLPELLRESIGLAEAFADPWSPKGTSIWTARRLWYAAVSHHVTRDGSPPLSATAAGTAVMVCLADSMRLHSLLSLYPSLRLGRYADPTDPELDLAGADVVRDVIGLPWSRPATTRKPAQPPGRDVKALTHAAWTCRAAGGELDPLRLAVLADSLEESGYRPDLCAHLRNGKGHQIGCWALTALRRWLPRKPALTSPDLLLS